MSLTSNWLKLVRLCPTGPSHASVWTATETPMLLGFAAVAILQMHQRTCTIGRCCQEPNPTAIVKRVKTQHLGTRGVSVTFGAPPSDF